MSVQSSKNVSGQKVPPAVIAIAVIALVLFVAWRGWVALSGPPTGPLPPYPTNDINFVASKAKETQGDFSKLSADDQAKIQKITHGWGQSAIASSWRKQKADKAQ